MNNYAAVLIRGQIRTWDLCKQSIFSAFNDTAKNVIYFFSTWDGQLETGYDIKKEELVKDFANKKIGSIDVLNINTARNISKLDLYEEYDLILYLKRYINAKKSEYELANNIVFDRVFEIRPDLYFPPNVKVSGENDIGSSISLDKDLSLGPCSISDSLEHTIPINGNLEYKSFMPDLIFDSNSLTNDVLNTEFDSYFTNNEKFFMSSPHGSLAHHIYENRINTYASPSVAFNTAFINRPFILDEKLNLKNASILRKNSIYYDSLNNTKYDLILPIGDGRAFKDVDGVPLIERVVNSINLKKNARYFFVCARKDLDADRIDFLKNLSDEVEIIIVAERTKSQIETVSEALPRCSFGRGLIVVNTDQLFTEPLLKFFLAIDSNVDAASLVFIGAEPIWSFSKVDKAGNINKVEEKKVISCNANAGCYFFKNKTVLDEAIKARTASGSQDLYFSTLLNEIISKGKNVKAFRIKEPIHLGSDKFIADYKIKNKRPYNDATN